MFTRVLVANRGEIACRVLRSAQRLGYATVAVFSAADAGALHVALADTAVAIGAAPAAASYLNIDAMVGAARRSGADAVHPGYGFLSENADFAQACADAGLVFIGPPAAAMRAMGDKAQARRLMRAAGVPCAAGYEGADESDARLLHEAEQLGPPLLVKAVAGGGGRGMRLVRALDELPAAIAAARREAQAAFGDGRLLLERLVEDARHIEVQVCCDAHGHAIHLGERDCSTQRRRQKLIEEAPAPGLGAALRAQLTRDAVAAAQAVGYQGVGTVEFVVDAQGRHCFLEMNTRLQVEHTVTECLTGIDLVEWQLRIAQGQPLPLTQEQLRWQGHAIQARLYAEDPSQGFAPQSGRVLHWAPEASPLRIDHGIAAGDTVWPWYDGLLAKFIAHGSDRDDAIRRLVHALTQVPLVGVRDNAGLLRALLQHSDFRRAQMTTTRLDAWAAAGAPLLQRAAVPEHAWLLAAALYARADAPRLRPPGLTPFDLTLCCQTERHTLRAPPPELQILARAASAGGAEGCTSEHVRYALDGVQRRALAVDDGRTLHLVLEGEVFAFNELDPAAAAVANESRFDRKPGDIRAPVAGVVAQVAVKPGDAVAAGAPLVCVEAMKMQMWQSATAAGVVRALHVAERDAVAAGALLVEIEFKTQ